MWAKEGLCDVPSLVEIGLIALCGGVLGVLMMIPLRSALIVKEHGVLAYPEGQACAEVLIAGEEGGSKASDRFLRSGHCRDLQVCSRRPQNLPERNHL